MPPLTPPTTTTFVISLLILLVGVAAQFVPQVAGSLHFTASYWLPVLAYVVLALGVLIRGV